MSAPPSLQQQLEENQNELSALQSSYDEYVESSKELESELESELEKAESELGRVDAELERTKAAKEDLSSELHSLTLDRNNLSSKVSSLSESLQKAEQAQDDAENNLRIKSESEKRLAAELDESLEQVAFIETEVEHLKEMLSQLEKDKNEEIKDLRGDIDNMKNLRNGEGSERDAEAESKLAAQLEEKEEENGRLESRLQNAKKDFDAQLIAKEGEISCLETALKQSKDELEAARDCVTQTNAKLKERNDKIGSLESSLGEAHTMLEDAVRSSEVLSSKLENTTSELNSSKEALDKEKKLGKENLARLEGLERLIQKKSVVASSGAEQLERAQKKLAAELDEAVAARAAAEESLAAAKVEINECKSALANMSMEANSLQSIEANLRLEVSQLNAKLKEAKKSTAAATATPPMPPDIAATDTSKNNEDASNAEQPSNTTQNNLPVCETYLHSVVSSALASGEKEDMRGALKFAQDRIADHIRNNSILRNKIHKISNAIQVACRISPPRRPDRKEGRAIVEALSDSEVGYFCSKSNHWKSFVLDGGVLGPDDTQEDVFMAVEPLCLSVVDGFNACIMAYGPSGSGKTYTIEGIECDGDSKNLGLGARALSRVLELIKFRRATHREEGDGELGGESERAFECNVELSILEIYNEEVFDLLGESQETATSVELKRDNEGKIKVPNLTKVPVSSVQDFLIASRKANKNRVFSKAKVCSRSHIIFEFKVRAGVLGRTTVGKLSLVDLASSEKLSSSSAVGKDFKDKQNVNLSLAALGDVMGSLASNKSSHIPYRNSKLTYYLKDSLNGEGRTIMIVTANPSAASADETHCALQFATKVVKKISGSASSSAGARSIDVKNLVETLKKMRQELQLSNATRDKIYVEKKKLLADKTKLQEKLAALVTSKRRNDIEAGKMKQILQRNNAEINSRLQKEKNIREVGALHI